MEEGDDVTIHVTSIESAEDQTHGFTIDMYNINVSLEPGKNENISFKADMLALNDVAMRLNTSESGLTFRGNDFHQNADMIEVDGGGDAMLVAMRGNHYSDYEGYDLDADGVGDVAYEVKALSSELTESRPSLKHFHGTAAMGLVDAVARAMPMLASHKLLVDAAPLTRRPQLAMPAPRLP